MSVWLGGNIRNNMWFGKQLISATNGIHSPFRWRTFRQNTQAHCQWCPSWPVREHRLLHRRHCRSYSWHSRHRKCIPVGSSNPPCNRSGSLTRQRERTNSLWNDCSKRLVISWGRPFRNKSDFGMAFQLTDAHCFPPGSQVHRMDSRNSEKRSHQNAPHQKTSTRPSDEWDMWISWFHGFTTSSVDPGPCITAAKINDL